ncbi:MAG: hypothetical protein IKB16_09550 [Lentisphaeria bacterium]|nr:hypothetical protein [Lentisphaeria bacterium]
MTLKTKSCIILGAAAVLMACSARAAEEQKAAEPEEKVQKITFVEDDAQKSMGTKIYQLKHTKAADLAPFVRSAVLRYTGDSTVSCMSDGKRELLIVSTGVNFFEYADQIIASLDRKSTFNQYGSNITGNGIAYGFYTPKFRGDQGMLDVIVNGEVASPKQDAEVKFDAKRNFFYFKDTPSRVKSIKEKISWLDREIPQARVDLAVYEVRESNLKDIGLDYLAWKNGPGMNLISAGLDAMYFRGPQAIFDQFATTVETAAGTVFKGTDYAFGGFYTAPSIDMSFLRLLQQDGKATLSATASVMISNVPDKTFAVGFSPEYQNLTKDEDHVSSVAVGGNAIFSMLLSNAIITNDKAGKVNFNYELKHANVVERNNYGNEILDKAEFSSSASIPMNQETILVKWEKVSKVEQTIGIPFLCELPILKYIFGTTTSNEETVYLIVTARVNKVNINEKMPSGKLVEFDDIAKK